MWSLLSELWPCRSIPAARTSHSTGRILRATPVQTQAHLPNSTHAWISWITTQLYPLPNAVAMSTMSGPNIQHAFAESLSLNTALEKTLRPDFMRAHCCVTSPLTCVASARHICFHINMVSKHLSKHLSIINNFIFSLSICGLCEFYVLFFFQVWVNSQLMRGPSNASFVSGQR